MMRTIAHNPNDPNALLGDKVLLGAVLLSSVATFYLAYQAIDSFLPAVAVGLICIFSLVSFGLCRAKTACRYLLTFALVCMVALQIQLSHGQIEWHFGVFVTLAFLLVYLDWKIIVYGAALFAVQHILFDRLQAAGFGTYCTAEPNFLLILFHASYVSAQSGVEIILAISMGRAAREGRELSNLVAAVSRPDHICLNINTIETSTPGGTSLKNTLLRMENAVDRVRVGAESINNATAEIAKGNIDLSKRTELTAGNLESVASKITELSTTTQNSAKHANEAKLLTEKASQVAAKGRDVVGNVISTMQDIQVSSNKINDIISTIDGIAFQTNILALNAAVEAARAGEVGRGFAVVASEVRNLAGRSASAANQIKSLISESQASVKTGSTLVDEAGETMGQVLSSIEKVSKIITELHSANVQQSHFAAQVSQSSVEIDSATQENSALVEEMAEATSNLQHQSDDLVTATSIFETSKTKNLLQ